MGVNITSESLFCCFWGGVNASVNLSRRISLFGEARYQSIPIDGMGEIKWGGVFTGGIKFYF